jgi:flagellar biosynthesis/type III secretory pathway protein FliH
MAQETARLLKPHATGLVVRYRLESGDQEAQPQAEPAPDREQLAYERGLAEGERRMREMVITRLDRQNELLAMLVREIQTSLAAWLQDAEEPIVALALAVAQKVLHGHHEGLKGAIVEQTRQALARIRAIGPVTVRVHPEDAAILDPLREAFAARCEGLSLLQIEPDARISRGGCLVETPEQVVDARIETQLARIAEALKQQMTGLAGEER